VRGKEVRNERNDILTHRLRSGDEIWRSKGEEEHQRKRAKGGMLPRSLSPGTKKTGMVSETRVAVLKSEIETEMSVRKRGREMRTVGTIHSERYEHLL
jgi:hypothetical protein